MKLEKPVISEDIQRLLKTVYDDCVLEDTAVRERQTRKWRELKLLWEGFSRIWFSEVAHDWRIWDETEDDNSDQAAYDKPINVFKAYLESVIAALSVVVPPVKCFPDDADNTLDLATAKAGDKISQLIYRHNNASLLWLHMLFTHVTEGMVAIHSYPDYDEKYGTYDEEHTEEVEEETESIVCSQCGYPLDEESLAESKAIKDREADEFMPGADDVPLHSALDSGKEVCPACMQLMDPEVKKDKFITTRITGKTKEPKGRVCIESYGGLYIKIPNYCKNQKTLPYLIFSEEKDYSIVVEEHEHLHGNANLIKKIKGGKRNPGGYEYYAQWGRLSPQYQGEYPANVVTVNKAWIRPAKFNVLADLDDVKKLKKLFPDGVVVTFIDDEYACAENSCLDDYWTLTENPLSDYLHFEPTGSTLKSIQDITNDLVSLTLQTIEHGIGQTFADPAVLNFNAYGQTSVLPGGVFPATSKSGKSLGEGFFELRTATLSPEVQPFGSDIQSFGQLVSGATPSIFGGQLEGAGGDTASGYSMSRAQALQRLQNTWKLFTTTWKDAFGKIIPMYIKLVQEDERDVQMNDDGNFVNILIRKADLEGKIGRVELEAAENLPLTWTQKKDIVFTLLQGTNPKVMEILNAPENAGLIHDALGLVDFYVPGEDDVIKQYDEIKILLNSTPIVEPPDPMMVEDAAMQGMPPPQDQEMPSVEIDPIIDNHTVEFATCRKYLISEAGRLAKTENAEGYKNVLLHAQLHFVEIQKAEMAQMQMDAASSGNSSNSKGDKSSNVPSKKRDKTKDEAPVTENKDVSTVS